MKRRFVLKNKKRFYSFIFSVALLIALVIIFNFNNNALGFVSPEYDTVYITEGDTLWAIATTNLKRGSDIRKYIHDIRQLNDLETSTLYVGQQLIVPR